jgi:hypothetical protein
MRICGNCYYSYEIRETPDTFLIPISVAEQLIGVSAGCSSMPSERILVFAEKP